MESELTSITPWLILPFGILLGVIALGPLLFPAWWVRHYPKVAYVLGAVVVAFYLFLPHGVGRIGETAHEYISFIAMVGSLFVVSGGIHLNVKAEATPRANVVFLLVGAVAANVLGTTGASMLLIRPWLRMNKYRVTGHHVVFFIFIVSNVGGCLTPIADPPLFLGYLQGVPFWWVAAHCLPMWGAGVGLLLAMFYVVDYRNYRRSPEAVRPSPAEAVDEWRCEGLGNIFFLAVILAAVFIKQPIFVREGLMIAAALGSYATTRKSVHEANRFDFHPLQEVAILFVGIFATMMPALDWLQAHSGQLGHATPTFFYWGSGTLSSALDNAPTYLCFLKTLFGRFVDPDVVAQVAHLVQSHASVADLKAVVGTQGEEIRQTFAALQKYHATELARGIITPDEIKVAYLLGNPGANAYLVAISVGAVFFGANTYIGNGPNFMVKSIAEQEKVQTPTFLAYLVRYTLPFMVPMLAVIWWFFFRR